ncbi:MAG TPA: GAF domain-containing protein [Methanobacterium sp.]|nr:GAF domain-containing protein [Methanobacterium sp.]
MDPKIEIEKLDEQISSGRVKSFKEVSDQVLEVCRKITLSEHCYVAYVDPVNKDSVGISFSHMTGACQYYADIGEARFPVRKDGSYGGLLGYSLDTGISFYVKNPKYHPAAHGMPPGHVPVDQFLSVPVINNKEIIGQIVLGNPLKDYNNHHLELINEIADIYGLVIRDLIY